MMFKVDRVLSEGEGSVSRAIVNKSLWFHSHKRVANMYYL